MTLGDAQADGFPTFGYYPDPERLDVALGRGSFVRALVVAAPVRALAGTSTRVPDHLESRCRTS